MRGVCAIVATVVLLPTAVALAYGRDDHYSGRSSTGRGVVAEIRGDRVRGFSAEVRVQCSDGSYVPWLVTTGKKHPRVVDGKWTLFLHPQQTPAWTVRATGTLRRHRRRMVGSFSVSRPAHGGVRCSAHRTYRTHRVSSKPLG